MAKKPHSIKVRLTSEDHEKLQELQEACGADTVSEAVRLLIDDANVDSLRWRTKYIRPVGLQIGRMAAENPAALVLYLQGKEYEADMAQGHEAWREFIESSGFQEQMREAEQMRERWGEAAQAAFLEALQILVKEKRLKETKVET